MCLEIFSGIKAITKAFSAKSQLPSNCALILVNLGVRGQKACPPQIVVQTQSSCCLGTCTHGTLPLLRTSYDKSDGPIEMDITTDGGFMLALQLVLRVKKGGLLWLGVPCCSFIWLARGSTGRSREVPCGDESQHCTRVGNLIAARACLLAAVAICRQVDWVAEQPGSSTFPCFPCTSLLTSLGDVLPHQFVRLCQPQFRIHASMSNHDKCLMRVGCAWP